MTRLPSRWDLLARWDALGRPLARLPRWAALAMIAGLLAAMGWSAFAVAPVEHAQIQRTEAEMQPGKGDMALYARISERVAAGEDYYTAAMEEQRAGNYPTRPFVTVRLPTLAWLHKSIGPDGVRMAALSLLLGCLWGLHRKLGAQTAPAERIGALFMLALGGAALAAPLAGYVHEVLAGVLLSLAFLLYDRERWWLSLLAAAAALAVRELAVHFILLWLAFALFGRRWGEAAAIAGVLILFTVGMYLHYLGVEAHRLPGDPASQGWDSLSGPALPLMALSRLTALLALPAFLAAPLAILPLVGWLGLGGRAGLFAGLWFAGFLAAMAIFARVENFYWAQLVLPAYFAGLALAPRALADLARSAGRQGKG